MELIKDLREMVIDLREIVIDITKDFFENGKITVMPCEIYIDSKDMYNTKVYFKRFTLTVNNEMKFGEKTVVDNDYSNIIKREIKNLIDNKYKNESFSDSFDLDLISDKEYYKIYTTYIEFIKEHGASRKLDKLKDADITSLFLMLYEELMAIYTQYRIVFNEDSNRSHGILKPYMSCAIETYKKEDYNLMLINQFYKFSEADKNKFLKQYATVHEYRSRFENCRTPFEIFSSVLEEYILVNIKGCTNKYVFRTCNQDIIVSNINSFKE